MGNNNHPQEPSFTDEINEIDKDFVQSEDLVFLIETTSPYFQYDKLFEDACYDNVKTNSIARGYNILCSYNQMGLHRLSIDSTDRYMVIFYNRNKVQNFGDGDFASNPLELLENFSKADADSSMNSPHITDALTIASQAHLRTFRKIGDKTLRVIIITNSGSIDTPNKLSEIGSKILNTIGVIVDVLKIGRGIIDPVLEDLVKNTGGSIYLADNLEKFQSAFSEFEKKKKILLKKYSSEHQYSQGQIDGIEPLYNVNIEKIASNLKLVPESLPKSQVKCNICFSDKCKHHKNHLRTCPNCGIVMHSCCAAMWSCQMKLNNPYVFRCPHCFFLLKVERDLIDKEEINKILGVRRKEIDQIRKKRDSKNQKLENLKNELISSLNHVESKKESTPLDIFEDWIDEVKGIYPDERQKMILDFKELSTSVQRNQFIDNLIKSKKISANSPPHF